MLREPRRPETVKQPPKGRFRLVKLEERIAPSQQLGSAGTAVIAPHITLPPVGFHSHGRKTGFV